MSTVESEFLVGKDVVDHSQCPVVEVSDVLKTTTSREPESAADLRTVIRVTLQGSEKHSLQRNAKKKEQFVQTTQKHRFCLFLLRRRVQLKSSNVRKNHLDVVNGADGGDVRHVRHHMIQLLRRKRVGDDEPAIEVCEDALLHCHVISPPIFVPVCLQQNLFTSREVNCKSEIKFISQDEFSNWVSKLRMSLIASTCCTNDEIMKEHWSSSFRMVLDPNVFLWRTNYQLEHFAHSLSCRLCALASRARRRNTCIVSQDVFSLHPHRKGTGWICLLCIVCETSLISLGLKCKIKLFGHADNVSSFLLSTRVDRFLQGYWIRLVQELCAAGWTQIMKCFIISTGELHEAKEIEALYPVKRVLL